MSGDTGYIIGIIIGGIVIIFGFFILMYFKMKNFLKNKISKNSIPTSTELINQDIFSWAKKTNNIFMDSFSLKIDENNFCDIDSILLTSKAMFVIEIKSITGVISGSFDDKTFIKTLDGQNFMITNSIKQNDANILQIQKIIDIKIPIISLIIYSNRASKITIKNIPSHVVVIRHSDLNETLDYIDKTLSSKIEKEKMKLVEKTIKNISKIKKIKKVKK